VNEILAHEAAGLDIEIFALRPNVDTHYQHAIADVRAAVTHLRYGGIKAETLWHEIVEFARENSSCWGIMDKAKGYTAVEVYQAILLARSVLERGVHHIHAHFATTAAAVARLASLLTGVPYSITAHAKDIFHESIDDKLLASKIADASAVVTVSDFNVNYLKERYPQAGEHIHRVYNGLSLADYEYSDPTDRSPLILAVGRLVEKKGFAILIDACKLLAAQDVKFQCKIVGGGDLASSLHEKVRNCGLSDFIEMPGPRPRAEVLNLMREAAVFAAPCITATSGDRDVMPTELLEEMASGAPSVSTELLGIPELVRNLETGLLVPEQDANAVAAGLRRLREGSELRNRLATAARELIVGEFDIDRNTAELRRVFSTGRVAKSPPVLAEVG